MNSGIIFSKGDAWETTYLSSPNAWRHLTQCLERRELQAPFLNVDKSYDSLENVTLRHYNLVVRSWCQRSRYRTTCILVGFNFPACERSLPRPEAPPKPMVHGGLQKKVPHITMLRRSNSTSAVMHSRLPARSVSRPSSRKARPKPVWASKDCFHIKMRRDGLLQRCEAPINTKLCENDPNPP